MTTVHFVRVHDPDVARDLIMEAARLGPDFPEDPNAPRHPVTIGYFETRKELRPPARGDGPPAWYPVPNQYVPAVRTMEFFDFDESADGHLYFTGLDRCPRDDVNWNVFGPPRIRRVRADRIEDITVHTKSTYRLQNRYFIDRVREHAQTQRWGPIASLTDDALWSVIELATSRQDAVTRAARYAGVELTPA